MDAGSSEVEATESADFFDGSLVAPLEARDVSSIVAVLFLSAGEEKGEREEERTRSLLCGHWAMGVTPRARATARARANNKHPVQSKQVRSDQQ